MADGVHGREACMAMGGGGMHGRGHAWLGGAHVAGCVTGSVHGRGACVSGGMHGGGHAWQGGVCGRGHAWQGGMCGRGACMAEGVWGGLRVADTTRYSQ